MIRLIPVQEVIEEIAWLDRDFLFALQVADETEELLVEHGAVVDWQELTQAVQGTSPIPFWELIDRVGEEDACVVFLRADEACDEVGIFSHTLGKISLVEGTVERHPGIGTLRAQRMPEGMMESSAVGGVVCGIASDETAELLCRGLFAFDGFQIIHVLS